MSTFLWAIYGIGVVLMLGFTVGVGRRFALRPIRSVLAVALWPLTLLYGAGSAVGDHIAKRVEQDETTTKPESAP